MRFVCLVALVLALLDPLQVLSADKLPKVAFVRGGSAACKESIFSEAFVNGLRALGHVPERTLTVERMCYGSEDEMRSVLRQAVAGRVDVIVVGAPAPAIIARTITGQIPIVCASCGDPLDNGLVASLARPAVTSPGWPVSPPNLSASGSRSSRR